MCPLAAVSSVAAPPGAPEAPGEKKPGESPPADQPSLERLVELNAAELFGGEASFKEGRVVIRFPGKGLFQRGFNAPGGGGKGFISDAGDLKAENMRKAILEGQESAFSFAAIDAGDALSRFEMAQDFKVSFKVRLVNLPIPSGSMISVRVNQEGSSLIQTTFFQDILVVDQGRKKRKITSLKPFMGPPAAWFPQRSSPLIPVEIVFKDGKATVSMTTYPEKEKPLEHPKVVEIVSMDGIQSPTSGRIGFRFSRMSFGVMDFVVEGKYHRPWAEAEIAKLTKSGKLKVKPPEVAAQRPAQGGAEARGAAGAAVKRSQRAKKGETDIDKPDPGADDDL
ncbi:MAG TPA: hypothetical protein VMT52_08235 [Planctomycetota bacterium]|nr:hypothetical protein [Planctomycetota bacterium]